MGGLRRFVERMLPPRFQAPTESLPPLPPGLTTCPPPQPPQSRNRVGMVLRKLRARRRIKNRIARESRRRNR